MSLIKSLEHSCISSTKFLEECLSVLYEILLYLLDKMHTHTHTHTSLLIIFGFQFLSIN